MRIAFASYDEVLPLKDLKRSKHQRNKHPKEQIERLALIMKEHGVRQPIGVSRRSGEVCFGHGRWEAARLNGWTEFPIVYQEFDSDEEEYSCVQSDNAIAHWAELDLSAINTDIPGLGPDFNLDLLGLEGFKLDAPFEAKADEDAVPEDVEPNARLGDVYQLGRHRLMCGDSTSIDAIDRLMNGDKADMVFTDPPYGMRLETDWDQSKIPLREWRGKKKDYKNVIGDHSDFSPELINTIFAAFNYADEIFIWGADYFAEHLPKKNDGSWVAWDKRGGPLDKVMGSHFELCWSKARHQRMIARVKWCGLYGTEQEFDHKRSHPTQKPVQLAEWFFDNWAERRTKVVDLYGGSGSTLIACEKTDRACYMMELDPHYIDVIIARWEKYTGQKAELLERTDEVDAGPSKEEHQ